MPVRKSKALQARKFTLSVSPGPSLVMRGVLIALDASDLTLPQAARDLLRRSKEQVAMAPQESNAADRRVTPRFPTSFEAELAAGSAVVSLMVHDLSIAGCGVEILTPDPDLADRLGALGLLKLPAVGPQTQGVILPVLLCNLRLEHDRLRYGLRFSKLSTRQARSLINVMDALI